VKVSVVTVTYQHERFLAQSLESALMQRTSFPYEIVLSDDCSSDGTRAIAQRYAAEHPESIRLRLPERNLGMTQHTAETISACRGEYIANLEGDDYWTHPEKLQRQADYLDANPDCSWCFTRAIVVNEAGTQMEVAPALRVVQPKYSLADYLARRFQPRFCTVMFRRGLFSAFPAWFYEMQTADFPLHVFNTEAGGSIGFIDEEMAAYRVHAGGVWSQGITPGTTPSGSREQLAQLARRYANSVQLYETIDRHLAGQERAVLRGQIADFAQEWSRLNLALGDRRALWASALAQSRAGDSLRQRLAPWATYARSWWTRGSPRG